MSEQAFFLQGNKELHRMLYHPADLRSPAGLERLEQAVGLVFSPQVLDYRPFWGPVY
jgi:hypothetical protein